MRLIARFARSEVTVLIEGETGTGKELAARALHYLGRRKGEPFVPLNCGALPDILLENELFGHRAGAFTDAKRDVEGLIGQADGGTLFLDEVDTLSPHGQVALLNSFKRASTGRWAEPHCGEATCVIAASNTPLESLVVPAVVFVPIFSTG